MQLNAMFYSMLNYPTIVFKDPEAACRYFERRNTLTLHPKQPLVIEKINSLIESGIIEREKLESPQVKSGLYVLNRIVLPLGKSLIATKKIELIIDQGRAILFGQSRLTLKPANQPILSTARDLVLRMVQSGRRSLTWNEQALFLALKPDIFNKIEQGSSVSLAFTDSLPDRYAIDIGFRRAQVNFYTQNIVKVSFNEFHLNLETDYDYSSPGLFAKSMAEVRRLTINPGNTLSINYVFSDYCFRTESNQLYSFLDQCLSLRGLEIDTFEGRDGWKLKFSENCVEVEFEEELRFTVKEAEIIVVQWDTFAKDLFTDEKRLTVKPNQKLVFLFSEGEENAVSGLDDLKNLLPCVTGLTWDISGSNQLRVAHGHHNTYDLPYLAISAPEAITFQLIPTSAVDTILHILQGIPSSHEAVIEADPACFRFILFQTFLSVLLGTLSEYSTDDLLQLNLKEEVLMEIGRLKRDPDFIQNVKMLKKKHFEEVEALFDFDHEQVEKISIEKFAPPVQTLLKRVFALVSEELRGSVFLTECLRRASAILSTDQ